jgi:hypothetical protein
MAPVTHKRLGLLPKWIEDNVCLPAGTAALHRALKSAIASSRVAA